MAQLRSSEELRRLALYAVIFAVLGVAHEVFWWATTDYFIGRNPRLTGRSSLWMFPVYACVPCMVMLVLWAFAQRPWWVRGLAYCLGAVALEFASGWFIRELVGVAPWDYSVETADGVGSPKIFHVQGLVCLEYLPIWFIEGLVAEKIYLALEHRLIV